jgi:hypothetical protein
MTKKALGWSNVRDLNLKKFIGFLNLSILLLLLSSTVQAQNTITGKVSDSLGAPLSDVSVLVKGSKIGSSTAPTGEFTLAGVPERATLVFTFVGLASQEIRLDPGQRSVSIIMREDRTALQDVVVTGFQRIDKKRFTGAAVTLKAEDVRLEELQM